MGKKNFKTSFDSLLLGEGSKSTSVKASEKEVRATFIVKASHIDKLKAISYWERKMIKNVIDEALKEYIDSYEQNKGPIQVPK